MKCIGVSCFVNLNRWGGFSLPLLHFRPRNLPARINIACNIDTAVNLRRRARTAAACHTALVGQTALHQQIARGRGIGRVNGNLARLHQHLAAGFNQHIARAAVVPLLYCKTCKSALLAGAGSASL